jgi:Domain of unknown function (DUF4381)
MSDPASLQNLHDIVLTDPAPFWPPAPGWYVVSGIILFSLTWMLWRFYSRWRSNAYRRLSLKELGRIRSKIQSDQPGQLDQLEPSLRELPELVKRTALSVWPREKVASLTGSEWLRFLDQTGNTNSFTKGDGRLLAEMGYAKKQKLTSLSDEQMGSLLSITEKWIREHRIQ